MEQINTNVHPSKGSRVIDIITDKMDITNLDLEIVPTVPLQLSGYVYDKPLDGKGVGGAHVMVHSPDKVVLDSTDTNSQGYFYFDQLPTGRYSLSASKSGYLATPFKSVDLELGIPAFLNMTLLPDSREPFVYGWVTNQAGKPIQDATVSINQIKEQTRLSTRTNVDGEFVLYSVPVGNYIVEISKNGYENGIRELAVASQAGPIPLPVVLKSDLDSTSEGTVTASVSGFITSCTGQPFCSAWVGLYSADWNCLVAVATTNYEGYYSFNPVPTGRYFIRSKAAVN